MECPTIQSFCLANFAEVIVLEFTVLPGASETIVYANCGWGGGGGGTECIMGDSKIENTPGQPGKCKAELTRVMQAMPKFKRSTQDSMSGANVVSHKTDPQHAWQRNNEFDFLYPL